MKLIISLLMLALPVWADMGKDEREAYQTWYDANETKDWTKAIEASKVYRDSFPQGQYAEYLQKWERGARVQLFGDAVRARNTDEMIKRGTDVLADDPENLDVLYSIATNLRVNELWAKPPVLTHAGEAMAFTFKAAQLIEAGKVPSNVDKEKWNKNQVLGTLYETLGFIEKTNKNTDKAIEYYTKSASLDSTNSSASLSAGILTYTKYQLAARKYRDLAKDPANKDTPASKNAKAEADRYAEAAVARYSEFLKATASEAGETERRAKVEKGMADAYKFLHPDAPDGWKKPAPPETPATAGVAR